MNTRIIEIDLENNYKELEILQDTSFGYAGEVWDAALVLSHFLINKSKKHNFSLKGKKILELGSGTGIGGLMCSSLGAKKVYLTDKDENLEILKKNLELNKSKGIIPNDCEVVIARLDWSKKEEYTSAKFIPKDESFDLILCSDLIWNLNYFDDLKDVINYFARNESTEVLMAYQYRQRSDIDFFNKMKEGNQWKVERVPESWLDEEYRSEDILIVMMKKIQ
jgi:predicted nicotinamide N-methyase